MSYKLLRTSLPPSLPPPPHTHTGVGDTASALLVSMGSGASLEDFYPSIAINSLMRILKDQALSQHHTMAIQVWCHHYIIL